MNKLNNSGPRLEPCGTPDVRVKLYESKPGVVTDRFDQRL